MTGERAATREVPAGGAVPAAPTSGRVVLFGATGYAGELTAREMARRGMRPVLAGRDARRLEALADELGGLDTQVADARETGSVAALVDAGDVLVTTVGPFLRVGGAALEAALRKGAHYVDSTGEAPFVWRVFEHAGPRAQQAGVGLLTAMGYDFVPGNLAGALALREAGEQARRLDVGYFWRGTGGPPGGGTGGGLSGGTRASAAGTALEPAHTWRAGRLVAERSARRVRSFELAPGRSSAALSIGGSEQLALPRLAPGLREIDVYLGWFGPATRVLQALSAAGAVLTALPGMRAGLRELTGRLVKGSTGGPDATTRARSRSTVIAEAFDAGGHLAARVRLEGPNGYDLTAGLLAWAAERVAAGGLHGAGALGPVDGLGLDELEAGAAELGLVRV